MALFPMFIDLEAKKCVVVGGGKVAARKVETLIAFGAEIIVVSPFLTDRLRELKENGAFTHHEKAYAADDLEGAFLAVAAASDREVNSRVAEDAANRHIFVNVADDLKKCTFVFPAVAKKDGIVIGITTSGILPHLSKMIREKIENMLAGFDGTLLESLGKQRRKALAETYGKERETHLRSIYEKIDKDWF